MRSQLGSAAAIAAALFAGSAIAADLPMRKEPPPPPVAPPPPPTWNGLYLGLNIGGGWVNNNINNNDIVFIPFTTVNPAFTPFGGNLAFLAFNNNNNNNKGGVVGGGQVGYNYQFANSFVLSAEADIQGTSIGTNNNNNNSFFFNGNNFQRGLPWFGTVRGRLGFLLMPSLLVYGTGGFAYGGIQFFNQTRTDTGWTAGGGLEYLFWQNWSAKVEYLFVDLYPNNNNNNIFFGFNGFGWVNNRHLEANVVRVGLNWHFNFNPPPPVLARY
jgi:outer membrane immunogenic protein